MDPLPRCNNSCPVNVQLRMLAFSFLDRDFTDLDQFFSLNGVVSYVYISSNRLEPYYICGYLHVPVFGIVSV